MMAAKGVGDVIHDVAQAPGGAAVGRDHVLGMVRGT